MGVKPLRVLQVVASSRGGGAAHVRELALGLDRGRVDAAVAMPEDGGTVSREDFGRAGIAFFALPIARGFSRRAVGALVRWGREIDVLHVHGARAALFGRLAAAWLRQQRPRVIYTVHGFAAPHYPQPRRAALLAVERALAPLTDRVVAVCHAEREELLAAKLARPDRVQVVWNGVDVSRFAGAEPGGAAPGSATARRALGLPPAARVLTTVCRLDRPRDFDTLLAAFAGLCRTHADLHLLVVGDGPLRPAIERQVASRRLAGQVTLAGWQHDMPGVYAASDLYVLTTWGWEGLPLSVLEAMASGLAVVATRAGGMPEAIVDGGTGRLVERGDAAGLSAALGALLDSAAQRAQMGAAGRARAVQHFTTARMVAETCLIYEAVCAERRT
jgi:glycosyltransferase involved in cell wall biosynthesis